MIHPSSCYTSSSMPDHSPMKRRSVSGIPRPLPSELPRLGILERLRASRDVKLVVLIAPAGYGKTTALAQYSRTTERRTAWTTLSEDDASVSHLAGTLGSILTRAFPELNLESFPRIVGTGATPNRFAFEWANALNRLEENVNVVIDRIEHLSADGVRWLERFLMTLEEGHQVLLAGYETLLPLAHWVASGTAVLLEGKDLMFSPTETQTMLQNHGERTNPVEVHRTLEGWPAGIALVSNGANARLEPRDLVLEVLHRLPSSLREQLAEAGVLDVWSESEARAIGCQLPRAWLSHAQRIGLPVTPIRRGVVRPHTVVLNVLNEALQLRTDRFRTLHGAAGVIAAQSAAPISALQHFVHAQQLDRAVAIATRVAPELLGRREYRLARQILEMLPRTSLSPALTIRLAQSWMETGDAAQAELLLNDLRANGERSAFLFVLLAVFEARRGATNSMLALAEEALQCSPDAETRARALILISAAHRELGQPQEELSIAKSAADLSRTTGNADLITRAIDALAVSYGRQNDRVNCERHFRQVIDLSERLGYPLQALQSLNNFANFLSDWGREPEALETADRGVALARREGGVWLPILLVTRGLQHLRTANPGAAERDLQEALPLYADLGLEALAFSARLWLTQALSLLGKDDTATVMLAQARVSIPVDSVPPAARFAFVEGWMEFRAGDFNAAREHIEFAVTHGIDVWDEPRAYALLADIARRQGRLVKQFVTSILEAVDELRHDHSLRLDQDTVTALFTECQRRRWLPKRFTSMLETPVHSHAAPRLEIRSLGGCEIRIDASAIHVPLSKSLELLLWWAVNGPTTRDEALRAVWGEDFGQRGREYFRVAVRKLRACLSVHPSVGFDPVPFEHGLYRLNPRFTLELDVLPLLEANIAFDEVGMLEVYGDFFPGCDSAWVDRIRRQAFDHLMRRLEPFADSLEHGAGVEARAMASKIRKLNPSFRD
jgi:LuxR family transcriptional regulator, maltose regulon positive regulatory protein